MHSCRSRPWFRSVNTHAAADCRRGKEAAHSHICTSVRKILPVSPSSVSVQCLDEEFSRRDSRLHPKKDLAVLVRSEGLEDLRTLLPQLSDSW